MMSKQIQLFWASIALFVLLTYASYAYFFTDIVIFLHLELPSFPITPSMMGLLNAGFALIAYSIVGLVWLKLSGKVGLPKMYLEGAARKDLFLRPLIIGAAAGVLLLALDWIFYMQLGSIRIPHPALPFALLASATSAIGEEIFFRGFILCLWFYILSQFMKDEESKNRIFWVANIIAAISFGVGHLPLASRIMEVPGLLDLSLLVIFEIIFLNAILGILAGREYLRSGLIAAIGVHFWANLLWHVLWQFI